MMQGMAQERGSWFFLTTHTHVLLYVAAHSDASAREIAAAVEITERHTHRVLADLCAEGYLDKERRGARNIYRVRRDARFKHPRLAGVEIGTLLDAIELTLQRNAD
jgi:predicted ArsR family transcriptional regulator